MFVTACVDTMSYIIVCLANTMIYAKFCANNQNRTAITQYHADTLMSGLPVFLRWNSQREAKTVLPRNGTIQKFKF